MRYIIFITVIVTVGVTFYWSQSKWTADPTVPKDVETAWTDYKVLTQILRNFFLIKKLF